MKSKPERLILREFIDTDADTLTIILQDTESTKYMGITYPYTIEVAKTFIQRSYKERLQGKSYFFAVVAQKTKKVLGYIGLQHICTKNRRGELEFCLGKEYWGQGYGSEMVSKILHFGFCEIHLHKIFAHVRAPNVASCTLLEKFGFHKEGILRENVYDRHDNVWLNHIYYGLLHGEYNDNI